MVVLLGLTTGQKAGRAADVLRTEYECIKRG